MGSRARALSVVVAVMALTLGMAATVRASSSMWLSRTVCTVHEPAKAELKCGRLHVWHENGVLRWIKHNAPRAPAAQDARVVAYYTGMRRNHSWLLGRAHHWVHQAKHRLWVARQASVSHGGIAHQALWLCIHSSEGAWNDPNSGSNGHYGGLQMTSPWGKGVYYVYRADWLTPYEQMRKAELGYKASGYSTTWLMGQWNHPDCLGYA